MTTLKLLGISGIFSLLILPQTAVADSNVLNTQQDIQFTSSQPQTQKNVKTTITELLKDGTLTTQPIFDGKGTYAVKNVDGFVFINHAVEYNELPAVATDVKIIETYEFSYDGKTFQNKVVLN